MATKKHSRRKAPSHHTVTIINQNVQSSPSEGKAPKKIVKRKYSTALLLSIFLGWIGIDRFYVGHTKLGLGKIFIWLTVYGGVIWWIIDIIMFATKNVKYVEWS